MKIPDFYSVNTQEARIGCHVWSVARLIELSKNLPVMEIPLDHLNIWHKYEKITIREMVMHINVIMNADLNFPIILDEDGEIMDGRHRIMKALFQKKSTIKAVRFDENPSPCKVIEE